MLWQPIVISFTLRNKMMEYGLFFSYFICSLVLSIILALLLYIVPVKSLRLADKISAYECGFQPYSGTRSTVDVKYYIVAILFVLFDLEVLFLLPICLVPLDLFYFYDSFFMFWLFVYFFFLIIGFFYEYLGGGLDWS